MYVCMYVCLCMYVCTYVCEVFLTEVAVPFDGHVDECYAGKSDKYVPLTVYYTTLTEHCVHSYGKRNTTIKKNLKK